MTIPIPTLSPTPVRGDPDTFSTAFETFLSGLDPWAVAVQAVGDAADVDATAAAASAATATAQVGLAAAQVGLATAQAVLAEASADAAAGSALVAGAVVWVSGTTYAIGDCRYSPINFQTYRRTTSGAGTTDPSADSTNWTKALQAGISAVTTATGMTTLTSTATLLKITPASYGVAVTLPDATTCSLGGPLHIIDNRGAYPVRVLNYDGTLLGFIFAGVVSHVSLIDNSSAAGVWTVENSELVGASAQLLTTNMTAITSVIDIGSSRELILGVGVSSQPYAVVYDRSTNTFGPPTLVRAAVVSTRSVGVLSATNQVLVVYCNATTGFEAVTLSISGTTITVNASVAVVLSANFSAFADGCGLIAVGSSFVTSYTVATPAAQIRALSISGTTVTIGSATVLNGTEGGLIAASGSVVIAVSNATTHLYTKPYTVSGSTLSAGTGTDTNEGAFSSVVLSKLSSLGTRWAVLYYDGTGAGRKGGVVSLASTTTTISVATLGATNYLEDAIVVGSNKVLCLGDNTTNNANILTDTAGTASAGTAITLSGAGGRACLYANGTDVYVSSTGVWLLLNKLDCSSSSPVIVSTQALSPSHSQNFATRKSNAVLSRSGDIIYCSEFAQTLACSGNTNAFIPRLQKGIASALARTRFEYFGSSDNYYRGKADSERWAADGSTVITKLECAT